MPVSVLRADSTLLVKSNKDLTKSDSTTLLEKSSNVAFSCCVFAFKDSKYLEFSFAAEPAEFNAVSVASTAWLKFERIAARFWV